MFVALFCVFRYIEQCKEFDHTTEWYFPEILVELKEKAKRLGLWNLFLPVSL